MQPYLTPVGYVGATGDKSTYNCYKVVPWSYGALQMAENKWVSLSFFHPYKWRYAPLLLTCFWAPLCSCKCDFSSHVNPTNSSPWIGCNVFSVHYFDLFSWCFFTDCTMGFITMQNHHLGEYVWNFFQASFPSKSKQGTYIFKGSMFHCYVGHRSVSNTYIGCSTAGGPLLLGIRSAMKKN